MRSAFAVRHAPKAFFFQRRIRASDVGTPDWGDGVTIRPGEVPVFWACGVTPQTAIMSAKLPLAVTHAPGHMFVCDLTDDELFVATAPAESFGR